MKVVLADYGAGNLRSLSSALVRAGAEPIVTTDRTLVANASLAMIAGVGHVGSAAAGLRRNGLDDALRERVAAGRPVAGVCVGLQLFFGESEEGGSGLALLEGAVPRLCARVVPHMGWNTLVSTRPAAIPARSRPSRACPTRAMGPKKKAVMRSSIRTGRRRR